MTSYQNCQRLKLLQRLVHWSFDNAEIKVKTELEKRSTEAKGLLKPDLADKLRIVPEEEIRHLPKELSKLRTIQSNALG
jgi:hypothetical protein